MKTNEKQLLPVKNADEINQLLRRYGVKFGVYKNGQFKEQFFRLIRFPGSLNRKNLKLLKRDLFRGRTH